jgi:hypothetical protein
MSLCSIHSTAATFPPDGYLLRLVVVLGLDLLLLMYCRPRCRTGSWVFHTKVTPLRFLALSMRKYFRAYSPSIEGNGSLQTLQ